MGQIRLYIAAPKVQAEAIYAAVEAAFEEDGYPVAIVELDEAAALFEVSVYVDDTEAAETKQRFAQAAGVAVEAVQTEVLPEIDWVKHSLAGLQPVRAGRFFVHGSHDRDKIESGDLAIEIDAGQAFGTGHHGTTAGCLEMIARVVENEKPHNALDLGTGSGVLAIAIARLQPIQILASDIDPVAIEVALDNIRLNGVEQWVTAVTATGFDHEEIQKRRPFALIVANILALPLIELAPAMAGQVAVGGSVILSGILDSQHDKVLAAYLAEGLQYQETLHREGWVTIHLKRQAGYVSIF